MVLLSAPWVLPIVGPPIADGWIAVHDGRITAVGGRDAVRPRATDEIRLDRTALMPGLVNAHTHLELSHLRGTVAAAARFTEWIRELMRLRRAGAAMPEQAEAALERAIDEAHAAGTAVVADVSNTLASVPRLERSPLAAHVFFELLRFRDDEADEAWSQAMARLQALPPVSRVRVSVTPHAPYSVSSRLFELIRRHRDGHPAPLSIHLCESVEECELIEKGSGPWRELLEELDVWDPGWSPPGCSPIVYLESLGLLTSDTLVVHGVHLTDGDLDRLREQRTTLVACPRSNRHVGVGDPPVPRFYEAGLRVALGTDSLTSAPDLNVFGELAAMRHLAPAVPAARLLESATRIGARALGFDDYGVLAPGARSAIVAVELPEPVGDVEEYLVSGISPAQIRWPLIGC